MDIYGASGALPRGDLDRMDSHAERYYEEIRKRKSDIKAVAKNVADLGFTVQEIRSIKRHVFVNKYALEGKKLRHFDPDYDMAVSWQRLIDGRDIREMDIVLLQHELLECNLMSQGMSYTDAHNTAEKQYNYKQYTVDLDRKAGIR